MRDEREQWLQQRAYSIWEAEGRPDGRDREHWEQAERELAVDRGANEHATALDAATEQRPVKKTRKRSATALSASAARSSRKKPSELRP